MPANIPGKVVRKGVWAIQEGMEAEEAACNLGTSVVICSL